MIPVRDVIPSRRAPVVTLALVAANLAAFLWLPAHPPGGGRGAVAVAVTALLGHPNWPHLVLDLLVLWIFGENVEDRLGRAGFAALYAGAAGVGTGARALVLPGFASGATGAIAGVAGAYLVLFPRSRALLFLPLPFVLDAVEVPAAYLVVVWFMVQVAVMLRVPGVGDAMLVTSAAGFLAGAGTIALAGARRLRRGYWRA